MDSLHIDLTPYLVELGAADKRPAEDDLYDERRTQRAAYAPADAALQTPAAAMAQYQSMRRMLDMLRYINDHASEALRRPSQDMAHPLGNGWNHVDAADWFRGYRQDLVVMATSIGQFNPVFDAVGASFKRGLLVLEDTIRKVVVQIDARDQTVDWGLMNLKHDIARFTSAFRPHVMEMGC